MPEAPYTVHDTPDVVRLIDEDLALIRAEVAKADPSLRCLILTGGFARGEGAVRNGRPQNDYDLVAVHGMRPSRPSYRKLQARLTERLGLHIDLAPIVTWRLKRVARSIFWYETALRGRVLWGENLLGRIPVRNAQDLDRTEALRLLVNRAAGLLLARETPTRDAFRLQAAKAFLAALDARMLALGAFPPSQTERWERFTRLRDKGDAPPDLEQVHPWLAWAYQYKVDPDHAEKRDAEAAWRQAARTLLDAVPAAVRHAGLPSLEAYARDDRFLDSMVFYWRSLGVHGVRRWVLHPTGRVRVATLRLLEASLDGEVRRDDANAFLGAVAHVGPEPLRTLDLLRRTTLQ